MSIHLPDNPTSCPVPPRADRDIAGRFAPGNRGKLAGTKNRATVILERMLDDEVESIGKVAIDLAKKGDPSALRLVIERVLPPRRSRTIRIENFPGVQTAADIPVALSFLAGSVAGGEITHDEADALAGLLEKFGAALETAVLEKRIDELEQRISGTNGEPRNPFTFELDRPDQDE